MSASTNARDPMPGNSSMPPAETPGSCVDGARRRARLPWVFTGVLGVGIVALTGVLLSRTPAEMVPPTKRLTGVATQVVTPRRHWESLQLPARLEADRSAVLSSEISGRLQVWSVAEGAVVAAGQEVARLNTDDLDAQLRQLEARRESAEKTVAVAEESLSMARVSLTQAQKAAASLTLERDRARVALDLAGKEFARVKTLSTAAIATPTEFDRAENAHALAQLDLAKAEDAMDRAAVTVQAAQAAIRQAEAALGLNRSQVREAERQLDALKVTLGKTRIVAPFGGRFEEHLVEEGEVVAPGEALGRVYDLSWLRAAVDVPDRYAPLLDATNSRLQTYIAMAMPGAVQDLKATLTIPGLPKLTGGTYAGVELPAEIHRVAQAASPTSNTFRVELRLQNPGDALKAGIIGQAHLSFLRFDQAIVIPLKAVQVAEVGPRVLVVETADGRDIARVRDIEPVSIQNDEVLVRGGLNAGDRLVVSGAKGIVDGEEVMVVMADGKILPNGSNASVSAPAAPAGDAATAAPREARP